MSIRSRNQIRGLLLVGVGGLGEHGHEPYHGHQDCNQGCRHCHIRLWRGWSMAEFDTQKLALEIAPTFSGNQVPPLSSCESVFRQSDLAKRLATSPSASATLIGLDPAKSRQHHSI